MSPRINDIGFGSHGHVKNSENQGHEGFSGSLKTNPKSYLKRNNSTELLGYSFSNIYNENAPQTLLPRS